MEIGSYNRRILVERREKQRDDEGGEITVWVPLVGDGYLWANIRMLNGTEALKADSILSTAKGSIRIRYREDIDPTCRITYRGTVFSILAVLPDLVGREHVDMAVETGASNG